MNAQMWLALAVGMTALLWMPYVLDRFFTLGIIQTFANPVSIGFEGQSAWAIRARRAHANAVESLVTFAPLALLSIHQGLGTHSQVTSACAWYTVARLVHYVTYALGVPFVRTVAFLAGFGAQVAIAVAVLQGAGG